MSLLVVLSFTVFNCIRWKLTVEILEQNKFAKNHQTCESNDQKKIIHCLWHWLSVNVVWLSAIKLRMLKKMFLSFLCFCALPSKIQQFLLVSPYFVVVALFCCSFFSLVFVSLIWICVVFFCPLLVVISFSIRGTKLFYVCIWLYF